MAEYRMYVYTPLAGWLIGSLGVLGLPRVQGRARATPLRASHAVPETDLLRVGKTATQGTSTWVSGNGDRGMWFYVYMQGRLCGEGVQR